MEKKPAHLLKGTAVDYQNTHAVFALIFFHLLPRKPNLEKFSIYSNIFFHNSHSSKSSFIFPGQWASLLGSLVQVIRWLARRLHMTIKKDELRL
jgi:hypothetical protein